MQPLNEKGHSLEGEEKEDKDFSKAAYLVPDRIVHEQQILYCDEEWQIAQLLQDEFNSAKVRVMPVTLIIAECENYFEMLQDRSKKELDIELQQLAESFSLVLRSTDRIVRTGHGLFAIILYNVDQYAGASLCQVLKEALRKFIYFKSQIHPKYGFAVADIVCNEDATVEKLIASARSALRQAENLGEGAIVRSSDLRQSWQRHPSQHFGIGSDWLKKHRQVE